MKINPSYALLVFMNICIAISVQAQLHNPKSISYAWNTDTSKHDVNLADLYIAAPKDEIPTLDHPKFIKRHDKAFHYFNHEPVIAVHFNGRSKAYPLSILTLFELANDSLDGQEMMVTFCPMCNAALVYNRRVKTAAGSKLLHFGISGLLMHNDMVMYDKETQSWWEQLMGSAIVGEYTGTTLDIMPSMLISVQDYFDRFPDGEILSPEVGGILQKHTKHRPFHHAYHNKKTFDTAFFIPEKIDPRLPPLERVLDIHVHDHITIYPFAEMAKHHVLNQAFEGLRFVIFHHGNVVTVLDDDKISHSKKIGAATAFRSVLGSDTFTFKKHGIHFKDDQTGSIWDITGYCHEGPKKGKQLHLLPHSNHFAFVFLAFFPESKIYGQ